MQQTQQSKGFMRMRNKGFGNHHYTLSAWETFDDVKAFAQSGAHQTAMKQSKSLSRKIITYTYQTEEFPNWKTAIALMKAHGRVLQFD